MRTTNFFLIVFIGLSFSYHQCFSNISFSSRNATIKAACARLGIDSPIPNWHGTLRQRGTVTGQPISFNEGILETNGTPALFTGTYDATSPQIVLTQNQS